ncbi:UNVERIFIED_CONTAM: hypothetical protein OHV15_15400 [Microbacterium sp. SLM126]
MTTSPALRSAAGRQPVRVWDIVVSSILLVGLAALAALMSFFGFFLAMASDPCGARECSSELIGTGLVTAVALPWVLLLAASVVTILMLAFRKVAFWVPIAAAPLIIGSWFLGAFIAAMGVPSA